MQTVQYRQVGRQAGRQTGEQADGQDRNSLSFSFVRLSPRPPENGPDSCPHACTHARLPSLPSFRKLGPSCCCCCCCCCRHQASGIPTRPSARPVGTASHNRTLWRNSTAAQVHEICTALPFVRYFLLTQGTYLRYLYQDACLGRAKGAGKGCSFDMLARRW